MFDMWNNIHTFFNKDVDIQKKNGFFDNLKEVGFNLTMKRIQQPFLLRYYLPCVAIVIVTQISFYIPPDAIPGRIVLLITLFLTIMHLLMSEQVKHNFHILV